jgi:hypothetical protein
MAGYGSSPLASMYFLTDTLKVGAEEVLVNGGAFDGNTVLDFVKRTGIEGAELPALQCAEKTISKFEPTVSNRGIPQTG